MGAGASKQPSVRRKIQAVSAFEEAGKRNREKRKPSFSRKSRKKRLSKVEEVSDGDISTQETKSSSWVRLREMSISGMEDFKARTTLRLSDFNKIVRKRTVDPEDEKPLDIPYGTQQRVKYKLVY